MTYDPKQHHRRSIRLVGHDYSEAGMYFVTVCTEGHKCLFGQVEGEEMRLNALGEITAECWRAIPIHFANVELDVFVIMPNHVHGIVTIADNVAMPVGATHASPLPPNGPKPRSIATIIGSFKSAVSKRVNEDYGTPGSTIWQRNYYEHVIRNELSLNRIRRYILKNPMRWGFDPNNPEAVNPQTDDPWREWTGPVTCARKPRRPVRMELYRVIRRCMCSLLKIG